MGEKLSFLAHILDTQIIHTLVYLYAQRMMECSCWRMVSMMCIAWVESTGQPQLPAVGSGQRGCIGVCSQPWSTTHLGRTAELVVSRPSSR